MATVADNASGNVPGHTPDGAKFAAGMQVRARDEDWLVVEVDETTKDGTRLDVRGISPLVRDQRAVFFAHENLDRVTPLRPEDTELVPDDSPECRRSRLFIEALLRKTPLPDDRAAPASRARTSPTTSRTSASRRPRWRSFARGC